VPVPINDMMRTFGLVFLDIGHRIIGWLRNQDFDWQRLMVVVSGRAVAPRPLLRVDEQHVPSALARRPRQRLPPDRLYIAPHAPSLCWRICATQPVAPRSSRISPNLVQHPGDCRVAGKCLQAIPLSSRDQQCAGH